METTGRRRRLPSINYRDIKDVTTIIRQAGQDQEGRGAKEKTGRGKNEYGEEGGRAKEEEEERTKAKEAEGRRIEGEKEEEVVRRAAQRATDTEEEACGTDLILRMAPFYGE